MLTVLWHSDEYIHNPTRHQYQDLAYLQVCDQMESDCYMIVEDHLLGGIGGLTNLALTINIEVQLMRPFRDSEGESF